jgi:hypothetical protein
MMTANKIKYKNTHLVILPAAAINPAINPRAR